MAATMLVDLDHLLATPIYDPMRCSIGFHPLHDLFLVGLYVLLAVAPRLFVCPRRAYYVRLVGVGLVIHMALDSLDCYQNLGIWYVS